MFYRSVLIVPVKELCFEFNGGFTCVNILFLAIFELNAFLGQFYGAN